mgnify:CR=1 FL=1
MSFDKGYISPYFMTDPKKAECVLENPYILIYEKKIGTLTDLLPILNKIATAQKPLLIIAEEVENEALAALVVNRAQAALADDQARLRFAPTVRWTSERRSAALWPLLLLLRSHSFA